MTHFAVLLVFAGMLMASNLYGGAIMAQSQVRIDAGTDKPSYNEGNNITVSGIIKNFDPGTHSNIALTYRTTDPEGSIVSLGQVLPNSKGSFSFDFDAGGSFFSQSGTYSIQLFFESVNEKISFSYAEDQVTASSPESNSVAQSDTKIITVEMNGPSIFYFDLPNQIIRASVEIQNYTPSDGQYFMVVTHIPTQKVLKDFQIYPKVFGNDLWGAEIAYPILESDITVGGQLLIGEYEILIRTEFDSQTASTTFLILDSSVESAPKTAQESYVPAWTKNTAAWWAQDKISETEFLRAIEYLIENGLMTISSSENEDLPSIIHRYSLPPSRTTEYAEITGELLEKHEGTLTLTIVKPDKSEEILTTFSRDGNFMTTMELTSESLVGNYQVYAEFENRQILVSAFNVKSADSPKVPIWIKNNADWWALDLISDADFLMGIQYLVEQGIITV